MDIVKNNPEADIATAAIEIENDADRNNPNVVKVVTSFDESNNAKAYYFTRSTAPYGDGPLYEHIGIYAYRREILEKFVVLPPSNLEIREKLEQLRAIENNISIFVQKFATDLKPLSIDTEEDLENIRKILTSV